MSKEELKSAMEHLHASLACLKEVESSEKSDDKMTQRALVPKFHS